MNRFLNWISRQLQPFDDMSNLGVNNMGLYKDTPTPNDDKNAKDGKVGISSDMDIESLGSTCSNRSTSSICSINDEEDDDESFYQLSLEHEHEHGSTATDDVDQPKVETETEGDENLSVYSPQSRNTSSTSASDSFLNENNASVSSSSSLQPLSQPPKPRKMTVFETIFQSIQAAYLKGDPNFIIGPDHPLTINKKKSEEAGNNNRYADADYQMSSIERGKGKALPPLPFDDD